MARVATPIHDPMRWDGQAFLTSAFSECGDDVRIGHNVTITNPDKVRIGNRVRIDPNVYISGSVTIGDNVQICAGAILGGTAGIVLGDWSFVGYHSMLFSASEDYSGEFGPVNATWGHNKVDRRPIIFNHFSGIASGVMVMPGVELPEGCLIGAQAFIYSNKGLLSFHTHYGRAPDGKWMVKMRHREAVERLASDPEFLR